MSGHLRYRIEHHREVYDVVRNKIIARFDEPADADAYIEHLRLKAAMLEYAENHNLTDYLKSRGMR